MLNQLIFRRAPRNLHKDPTRNALTGDKLERPQKGCGGLADPPLGPIRPNFLLESPTASLRRFRMGIVPPREFNRGSTLGKAT